MIEHISHCITAFANSPFQMGLAAASLAVAVAAILAMKLDIAGIRHKVILIYIHLAALFFTPVFFILSMKCGGVCTMTLAEIAALSVPAAFAASFVFGFFGIPGIYLRMAHAKKISGKNSISGFVVRHSAKLGIPAPAIYLTDARMPYAFSFSWPNSMIVLSTGLAGLLEKKEMEAVLLHEIHHARSKASLVKLSAFFMKFSPFSIFKKFNRELALEEKAADRFAAKIQGCAKFLVSAKKKISY